MQRQRQQWRVRWWMTLIVLGCDPAPSGFGPDAGLTDVGAPDAAPLDMALDAQPIDRGVDSAIPDAALADAGAQDAAPADAMAPDAEAADAQVADAQPADAQAPDAAVDQGVDAAPDMAEPDAALDLGPDGGPLCGDERRLPLDGVFTRVGPVDRAAYDGCAVAGDAWSAFIELDAPQIVTLKPGTGRVQLGEACDAGVGECVAGARRFALTAGRTDFVFIDTETVRVRSTPDCSDGADNDNDGRVDLDDPGCARADDWSEVQRPGIVPACANGLDDDGDGRADWPFNMRCPSPGSALEACRDVPLDALTSTTPETVLLSQVGGQPAALDCAPPADTIEVLLVAPWSGRARIEVDPIGAQAFELLRACEVVEACAVDRFDVDLAVTRGEVLRARIQGRPHWLRWQISAPRACANGLDDDGDGRIDLSDPGCRDLDDATEADPDVPPACSNGVDDDRDRGADFPEDFACRGPGGPTEIEGCAVADFRRVADPFGWTPRRFADATCGGADTAEVGLSLTLDRPTRVRIMNGVGYLRTDCGDVASERGCVDDGGVLGPAQGSLTLYVEEGATLADPAFVPQRRCTNGVDDDADGQVDLTDPGCTDRFDDDERDTPVPVECNDGVDNDDDGRADWPDDVDCRGAGDPTEAGLCPGVPDIAPVDRFVVLDDFDHLPITESVLDGRPVYAAVVPFIIDRPTVRLFPASPAVNWVPLEDCLPDDMRPFGAERRLNADRGVLLMRMEVDAAVIDPFVNIGSGVSDCRNGFDDDGDGLIDSDDPGCARQALTEHDDDDAPECADGVDNDGDGLIDGDDLECLGAADLFEGGVCVTDVVAPPISASATLWVVPAEAPRFGLGCGPATLGASVVVPIDLPADARVSARTVEGTGDPVLSLEQSCDAPLICVDDSNGLQAQVAEDLAAGRYALRVGRWDSDDRSPIQVVVEIE